MGRSLRCAGLQPAVRGVAACGARGCSLRCAGLQPAVRGVAACDLWACIVLHPCSSACGLCGLWMPMTPWSSLRSKASASFSCARAPRWRPNLVTMATCPSVTTLHIEHQSKLYFNTQGGQRGRGADRRPLSGLTLSLTTVYRLNSQKTTHSKIAPNRRQMTERQEEP